MRFDLQELGHSFRYMMFAGSFGTGNGSANRGNYLWSFDVVGRDYCIAEHVFGSGDLQKDSEVSRRTR